MSTMAGIFRRARQNAQFIDAYDTYYSLIFGSVYNRIQDRDDAEDITQEISIRLYNKIDEVRNIRNWLYGTMRMVILEFYKTKKTDHVNIDDLYNNSALAFSNGSQECRIIIEEIINDAGNFIKEKDRIIFNLVVLQGYSLEETARELGLTRDQVKYRQTLTMRNIHRALKERGITRIEDFL